MERKVDALDLIDLLNKKLQVTEKTVEGIVDLLKRYNKEILEIWGEIAKLRKLHGG